MRVGPHELHSVPAIPTSIQEAVAMVAAAQKQSRPRRPQGRIVGFRHFGTESDIIGRSLTRESWTSSLRIPRKGAIGISP